jgi:type II secretory pathway pseudopilin PulG
MKTRKHKFSMVEMLVVITIIAVMSSMIIGSFDKARDMAGRVTCLNNIKNISVMTELYRKNNKVLPYSSTWLTDFTFAAPYNANTYKVFNCNGDADKVTCNNAADLNGKTSYYYVPERATLEKNWLDGVDNGMTVSQVQKIVDYTTAAIYDKSEHHHKGYVNIVYIMGEESKKAGVGTTVGDTETLMALDVSNILNVSTSTSTVVATTTPPVVVTTTPPVVVATTTPPVVVDPPFVIDTSTGTVTVAADCKFTAQFIGAAISYGGQYNMPVNCKLSVSTGGSYECFGPYTKPVAGNLNNKSVGPIDITGQFTANTKISVTAKTWTKKSGKSGAAETDWTTYSEYTSSGGSSKQCKVLRNGDSVPQISSDLNQGSVKSFVGPFISNGKIKIADNQAIFLFELGTTSLTTAAADFQDAVVLVTIKAK